MSDFQSFAEYEQQPQPIATITPIDKKLKKGFIFSPISFEQPKPIDWLIRGIIERDTLGAIFGESGGGKSFAVLDMCLCVASGIEWRGHATKQGKVLYVAGEGKSGIQRRVAAWAQRYGQHDEISQNFLTVNRACQLPDDVDEFIEAIERIDGLQLLVLDTLQRTYVGDENSTRDMTAYVRALDEIREALPDLTILLVHHTGHAGGRARGSSVLRASLDAEIKVEKSEGGYISVACTKAKDTEPFAPITLQLKTEHLEGWYDEEGTQMSSATLHDTGHRPAPNKVLSGNLQSAMQVFNQLFDEAEQKLKAINQEDAQPIITIDEWAAKCREVEAIPSKRCGANDFRKRIVVPLEQYRYVRKTDINKLTKF